MNDLLSDSYFELEWLDGSVCNEAFTGWHSISEEMVILYGDKKKIALVCTKPVKKITIHHAGLEVSLKPQKGEQVYQAIKSTATLQFDSSILTKVIGRVVGIIKDGVVIEEQFINEDEKEIQGIRF